MKRIVVFCGSSLGVSPSYANEAHILGKTLAQKKIGLVYGGAKIGIMGAIANAVLQFNGEVIGVIPEFLKKKEVYHPKLNELIITKDMHQRKMKMHELSDGILMLPGGYGTLEEFFEMLTWGQLGLHRYPIGILNTNGFYNSLLNMLGHMVEEGFVKQINFDMLLVDDSVEGVLNKMSLYEPVPVPKWITKDQT
ncbi:TIGR00730 family Rossman fold protein [Croceitalea vernalis]|uniref:Cytokinin riboside 5'-monophosphate phosphoribohydrolase n=1 Tax=Croceitalea vernalis TaxID=3075599 RepID=A0ABU3BI17_9FLAO|nr:TIGR00730 family Rossman fold protein [Croceitalea sp. P007]MDT0621810.1 TIGR00730 family Rossman fold protein [Croceitalea sp. P007]